MNLTKEIKSNLSEILSESTAYGLPKIFKSKRIFFKLFWLAVIIAGSILTIYFTNESISNYLKYEKISKIEIIKEKQIQFPTITFCSKSFNKQTIQDSISKCLFNKKDCIDQFQMFYSFLNEINCFQFNSGKNKSNHSIPIQNSTFADMHYGLKISFKNNDNMSIEIYIDDPLSIIDGESYKIPDYVLKYEPYFDYTLSLFKSIENKLGSPYNSCYKDVFNEFELNKTIINYIHSKNISYKQENCHRLCTELEYINTNPCNCSIHSLNNFWLDCYHMQLNTSISNCTYNHIAEKSDMNRIDEKCKQYCPLECDSITYTYTAIKNKCEDESFSYIYIYFKELKYTKYSEIPKTEPFSFISEIGGILGLFIGCSFVSLFELAELLFEIGFILFGKKHQQVQPSQQDNLQNKINSLEEKINGLNEKIELIFKKFQKTNKKKV